MDIGGMLYLVTHFEYVNLDSTGANQFCKLPMTMTLSKPSQSETDGKLTVDSIKQVDFPGVNGLFISGLTTCIALKVRSTSGRFFSAEMRPT